MTPRKEQNERAELSSERGRAGAVAFAILTFCCTVAQADEPLRVNNLVGSLASNRPSSPACTLEAGRYDVFESDDARLVSGDTNESADVFVRDTKTGRIERINMGDYGVQANGPSRRGFISANGRYVAFESEATNLVKGDTNRLCDVFLHDRLNRKTIRISLRGLEGQADRPCRVRGISADGKNVLFESEAANLVKNDTNSACDVFVREWKSDRTRRVSVNSAGRQADGPSYDSSISPDGRTITFASKADNLLANASMGNASPFLRDTRLGSTIPMRSEFASASPASTEKLDQSHPPIMAIALACVKAK